MDLKKMTRPVYSYGLFFPSLFFLLLSIRFSIDRTTDQEMIFYIDAESGAITLGKNLDRETAGWHNITVKAVEAGMLFLISKWGLFICWFGTFSTSQMFQWLKQFKQVCVKYFQMKQNENGSV